MAGVALPPEQAAGLHDALAELDRRVRGPRQGRIFVLSGPSGVGKDSVIAHLKADKVPLHYVVHTTTRSRRPGEVDGRDYHFLTVPEFLERRERGAFLEWAVYLGNYYGTPRKPVDRALAQGADVLLKPEVQGAMQIRARYPDAVLIFIAPPNSAELLTRLGRRGTESEAEHQRRVERAQAEIACIPHYDYLVINHRDRLDEAVAVVKAIVTAEHQRISIPTPEVSAMTDEAKDGG